MSWPLQEDFKPGEPMVQVPMDWFNTVSKILNTLVTVGCTLERTASPSQETPWRLIVAAAAATGGVSLSNVTPLKDEVTAVVGNDTAAAHGTHVHPLAFDTTKPVADTGTGEVGTAATYPHRDHKHPLNVDATPPTADAGSGSAGSAATYPRRDHQHPLNVDATAPLPAANAAAVGTSAYYPHADHVHPAQPASFGTLFDPANAGVSAAKNTAWVVNNGSQSQIKIWRHRYYYDNTAGSEKIVGVQHYEIYNPVTGALIEVGAESTYTVTSPEYAV